MALGWFQHLAADRAIGLSGGSEPADTINAVAVEAMREVGVDITHNPPADGVTPIFRRGCR